MGDYGDLLTDIADLYGFNCFGGPLHIVLDDGNCGDDDIQYCLDTCHEHWSVTANPENARLLVGLVESIGKQLLALSESDREHLYDSRWGRITK